MSELHTATAGDPSAAASPGGTPTAPPREANRREAIGTVVSAKTAKTIVVRVERRVPHPKFKKIIRVSKKFHAHDEKIEAKEGDKVRIRECRPVSKLKRWELVAVLQH
jgi:small subunit ribosomal protein S17